MAAQSEHVRAIEELKARYCRALDTKDWPAFRELFTDDFVSDTSEAGGRVIEGADAFLAFLQSTLANVVTVHHVQQPEIRVASPTEAEGVWAMMDVVRLLPGLTMHGFGHYHETYAHVSGRWRIKTSKLTRLREEIRTPLFSVFVSDRMRRLMQKAGERLTR